MKRHRPHAFIRSVHARVEQLMRSLMRQADAEGKPVVCRAGCAWCCSEPVYAIPAEAALAADRIRAMPADDRARIEAAVRDVAARFAASPLSRQKEPNAVLYRRLRLPCPLLGADQRCTIYEDRPMGCRMHLAGKPAEPFCSDDAARPEQHFIATGHVLLPSMLEVAASGRAEYDHFVLLLAEELFPGERWQSAARERLEIEKTKIERKAPR